MASVLIVDDSRTSRKLLEGLLEKNGYNIAAIACNGEEAVSLYRQYHPDIVTMDITMPVLDGITSLKQIKQADPKAKIVMVTAAGQRGKMVEAIKYGADDFITKPFEPDDILNTFKRLLT